MRSYQKHINDIKNKRTRKIKKEKGFTLLEVLFAVAILAFGLLAIASMQITAIRGNFFAGGKSEAATWAQSTVERLLALPFADPDLAEGHYEDPDPPTGYAISWDVDDILPDTFDIDSAKVIIVMVTPQIRGVGQRVQLTCIKPRL